MSSLAPHNSMAFKQNDRAKKFAEEVKSLVETAKEPTYKAIADKLKWNNNALHLTVKGERNVPNDIFKRYTEIYKDSPGQLDDQDYQKKYIALLEKQIAAQEQLNELKTNLAQVQQTLKEMKKDMDVIASLQRGYQEYWAEHYPPKSVKPSEVLKMIHNKALSSLKNIQKEGIRI